MFKKIAIIVSVIAMLTAFSASSAQAFHPRPGPTAY